MDTILLIDDDEATNVLHKREIKKSGVEAEILIAENGEEGIELVKEFFINNKALPNVIFLDINMPRMNGWEFIEVYEDFTKDSGLKTNIVVMLTTSLNPDDAKKAEQYNSICRFLTKPLSREVVPEVISQCSVDN